MVVHVRTYVRNTACSGTCVESHTDSTYVHTYVGMQGKSIYSAYVRAYVHTVEPLYYKPLNCKHLYNKDTILCPGVLSEL